MFRDQETNNTLNVLELYRSFEHDPGHRGRNLPRWLEYSIHHDPNQITSVSTTSSSVPPTSESLINELDQDVAEDTLYEKHEIQDDNDDEAYYYSDLDINEDEVEEGSTKP